jgi:hypothetical protein
MERLRDSPSRLQPAAGAQPAKLQHTLRKLSVVLQMALSIPAFSFDGSGGIAHKFPLPI